jgi:hypothetical protein
MPATKKPPAVSPATPAKAPAKSPAKQATKAPATPKASKAANTPAAAKPARKPASAKPRSTPPKVAVHAVGHREVTPEQRRYYVEVAAYYIAERHGFTPGRELTDWTAAEAEIDRLLASGMLNP